MDRKAKFNIGDKVVHDIQGYRAVIVDVDPQFQASGRYNPGASKREFATRNPWYRVLIDNSNQETYVEECRLQPDPNPAAIENPHIHLYLREVDEGYLVKSAKH